MAWDSEKYELDRLIGKRQSEAVEANSCDYKGTSDHELNEIRESLTRGWERTKAILDKLTPQQKTQLHAYAKHRHDSLTWRERPFDSVDTWATWYGPDYERQAKDREEHPGRLYYEPYTAGYTGPRWLALYEDFMAITRIIAPQIEVVK